MDHDDDLPSGQNFSKKKYPAPKMRDLIEKTALFVYRNGVEMEGIIMERSRKERNAKFDFLCKSDPFHAFYQRKLAEFNEGGDPLDSLEDKGPEIPESHKYSVTHPQGITAKQLDIMMLTAQFEAVYGPSFLVDLEDSGIMNNCQFELVDPTGGEWHEQLVAAYSEVVNPPKDLKEKLTSGAATMTDVLERCFHHLQWNRFLEQRMQRVKEDDRA